MSDQPASAAANRRGAILSSRLWPPALLLWAVILQGLLWMPSRFYAGDSSAVRAGAIQFLQQGTFRIPWSDRQQLGHGSWVPGQYFFENPQGGWLISKYGAFNSLLFLPPLAAERLWQGRPLALLHDSRTLLLFCNFYQILAALLLAAALYLLARQWELDGCFSALGALACLYGTFAWHYARAQSLDLWQAVLFTFFLLALEHSSRQPAPPGNRRGPLFGLALATWALILSKIYLIAVPLLAWGVWRFLARQARPVQQVLLGTTAASLSLALVLNRWQFGSFWEFGYRQWQVLDQSGRLVPFDRFSLHFAPAALYGFILSPGKSVFLFFPPLLLAIAGLAVLWRRRHAGAVFLAATAVFYLGFFSCHSNWGGDWAYGPRYLLFFLPALALAGLLPGQKGPWRRGAILTFLGLNLVFSFYWQSFVHRLDFFSPQNARMLLTRLSASPAVAAYFQRHHPAQVSRQIFRWGCDTDSFPPLAEITHLENWPPEKAPLLRRRLKEQGFFDSNLFLPWLSCAP